MGEGGDDGVHEHGQGCVREHGKECGRAWASARPQRQAHNVLPDESLVLLDPRRAPRHHHLRAELDLTSTRAPRQKLHGVATCASPTRDSRLRHAGRSTAQISTGHRAANGMMHICVANLRWTCVAALRNDCMTWIKRTQHALLTTSSLPSHSVTHLTAHRRDSTHNRNTRTRCVDGVPACKPASAAGTRLAKQNTFCFDLLYTSTFRAPSSPPMITTPSSPSGLKHSSFTYAWNVSSSCLSWLR
eukprot:2154010-Rhodomonas_salina.5